MESQVEQQHQPLPVSHKAWAWFEANKKPTLYGAGAVVVVGLVVSFLIYQRNAEEVAASEALSKVAVSLMTGTLSGSPTEAYLKVATEHPNSGAGARALLLAAGGLYADGKYDEAKTQFERFKRDYASSPFIGQALLGVAACLDAKGNAREAMTAYQDVISRRPGDYVVSQARFSLARLHLAQNEPEKAKILLEEVERSDPYGGFGPEAGMRLEELKVKYPKLFATVAPLATASPPPSMISTGAPLPRASATPAPVAPKAPLGTNAAAPKASTPK